MIDVGSDYHQLRVTDSDSKKIAFKTWYEFVGISFGLTNAPKSLMDLMNRVFKQYFDFFIIFFINNILIYSITEEEHAIYFRVVLQSFEDH